MNTCTDSAGTDLSRQPATCLDNDDRPIGSVASQAACEHSGGNWSPAISRDSQSDCEDASLIYTTNVSIGGVGPRCFSSSISGSSDDAKEQVFLREISALTIVSRTGFDSSDYAPTEAKVAQYGGAMFISGVEKGVLLSDVVFSGFYAGAFGGALFVMDSQKLVIERALFAACAVGNSKIAFRGILTFDPDAEPLPSLSKDDSQEARRSTQSSYGGAVSVINTKVLKLADVVFEHNSATNGGAISVMTHEASQDRFQEIRQVWITHYPHVEIQQCDFHNNGAEDSGGALFASGSTIDITSSHFGEAFDEDTKLCSRSSSMFDKVFEIHQQDFDDISKMIVDDAPTFAENLRISLISLVSTAWPGQDGHPSPFISN